MSRFCINRVESFPHLREGEGEEMNKDTLIKVDLGLLPT